VASDWKTTHMKNTFDVATASLRLMRFVLLVFLGISLTVSVVYAVATGSVIGSLVTLASGCVAPLIGVWAVESQLRRRRSSAQSD